MEDKVCPQLNSCTVSGQVRSLKEMNGGTAFMNLVHAENERVFRYIPCLLIKEVAAFAALELCVGDHVVVTGKLDNWKTAGQKFKSMVIKVSKIVIVNKGAMAEEVDVDKDL